jgi:hypothetical protein
MTVRFQGEFPKPLTVDKTEAELCRSLKQLLACHIARQRQWMRPNVYLGVNDCLAFLFNFLDESTIVRPRHAVDNGDSKVNLLKISRAVTQQLDHSAVFSLSNIIHPLRRS